MKKLYSLFAVFAMSLSLAAQDFEVYNFGSGVSDGGTVTVYAEEQDYGFIMVECESNPNPHEGLMFKALKNVDVLVQARDLSGSNLPLLLCCGGTCSQGRGNVTKQFSANPNEEVPFQYGINFEAEQYATVRTEVTVTTANQTMKFYVNFVYDDPSGTPSDPADLNGDNTVNVGDVTTLVNMILGKTETSSSADLNDDGTVNVGDVTTLVNIILGKN